MMVFFRFVALKTFHMFYLFYLSCFTVNKENKITVTDLFSNLNMSPCYDFRAVQTSSKWFIEVNGN